MKCGRGSDGRKVCGEGVLRNVLPSGERSFMGISSSGGASTGYYAERGVCERGRDHRRGADGIECVGDGAEVLA